MKKIITLLLLMLFSAGFAQSYQWISGDGGASAGRGLGVAIDNFGNVYTTGSFRATITIGTTTLTSQGVEDVFLAKYDATGNCLWAKQFGGASIDVGYDVVTDASGNVYVGGSFRQTAQFGIFTMESTGPYGDYDAFILKTDAQGNVLWVNKGGGDDWDECRGIAISGDNVFMSGNFSGPANFGSITIDDNGTEDVYIAKYSTAGILQWVSTGGGAGADFSDALAADADGNVYATGYFSGTATFGSNTIVNASNLYVDAFIIKYDSAGNCAWAKRGGGAGDDDHGRAIATDTAGNVYVAGEVRGSGNFDSATYTNAGIADIVVAKYDSSGNLLYLAQAGSDAGDYAYGIAVAGQTVYITGLFLGIIQFGDTTLESAGSTGPVSNDIYLATLNTETGQYITGNRAGGVGSDAGRAVAADAAGNVYQVGYFAHGTVTFGPYTLVTPTTSGTSGFVGKLNFGNLSTPNFLANEINIYPNPAKGLITIGSNSNLSGMMKIYNVTGQVVFESVMTENIDVSNFPSGLYFLKLADGMHSDQTLKFVKQ
jgi:hypothetical protein